MKVERSEEGSGREKVGREGGEEGSERGAVAEWVRALACTGDRTVLAGFESHCGKLNFASELWQFRLPRFASVFRRRH